MPKKVLMPTPRRTALRHIVFAAAVLMFALPSPRGYAQPTGSGFSLNRFDPAAGGSDWFTLESIDFRGTGRLSLFLMGDYAHKPLVIYDVQDKEVASLVDRQVFVHVGGSVNLWDRVRVGAELPFAANQGGNNQRVGGIQFDGPSGAAIGDIRLSADVRLFGEHREAFRLAVGGAVYLPTGKKGEFTGDGQARLAPRLMAAGDAGIFAYALRLGFLSRGQIAKSDLTGVGLGNEVTGALALGIRPIEGVLIGPEVFGSSVLTDGNIFDPRATPVEMVLGGRFTIAGDWHVRAGVSPGLTQGLGSPKFRALLGLEYFPAVPPSDRDGDGIKDAIDACPDVRGRRTRDPRTNGCPPVLDRDRDGVLDPADACPTEPGPRSDDPRKNGCPLPPDRDQDGFLDQIDACPDQPGVASPDEKKNGCPLPVDRDNDGILDTEDACVDVPGERTTDPKTNGCPDRDRDTIMDVQDACPDVSGPSDPDPKKNGCPVARIEKGQIRIMDQVKFQTGSDVILPQSNVILEAVAKVLTENTNIKKIRIEGHTDNRGGRALNKKLSERRALSVLRWLSTQGGIERTRMQSQGFGMDRPLATNRTDEGRQDNRRVEFHIVDPAQETP